MPCFSYPSTYSKHFLKIKFKNHNQNCASCLVKGHIEGAGIMVQQLKALAAPPEDPGWDPSRVRRFTTSCNSSSQSADTFGSRGSCTQMRILISTHTLTHNKK